MPKGSQQTGSSTSSAETRAGAAQFPFYQAGLQNAGRIYGDADTYPNYAPPSPWQTQGYPDLYAATRPNPLQSQGYYKTVGAADNVAGAPTDKAYDAYGNLITGGGTSPAQPGYAQFAAGQGGPQQTADRVVNNAVNAAYGYANPITDYANQAAAGNLGQDQLAAVAQGKYTDASSNPYLRDMVNAALRPVSENYATSTAPTLDARFSAGGRYGSGAADVAAGSARDALARNLGEISTGMYGNEYRFERGQQDTAAQQYDAARRAGLGLGITGLTAAGNMVDQGERTALSAADLTQRGQTTGLAGLTSGFNTGLTTQQDALRNFPQFIQSLFAPGQATAQAGAGLSAQDLAGARGEIEAGTGQQTLQQQAYNAPFERLKQYMATIGAPSGGASSTQPIFGNPLTSALSGATGVLGLGKELGLGSAASSLFGGGGAAATTAGLGALFPGAAASALPAYAAALPEVAAGASAFAPLAAGAATIICTELVRQGRMPNTWRLAGMRQFMRYPAVARRGYWVWATPVVAHLRAQPDSRFSKVIATVFNWRAEDLAARNGVKGARRLIRGRLVTAAMVLPCLACGLFARRDYFPNGKDAPA
jgi:hypothetical protein